ncbi:hypothetical protein P3W85_05690 [Cupriavidus basilensis]|uniref:Uncharacterized protein n=1 Tax=Cupriavidus basilensis TaxID=68895 RepID=A0ABT6AKX1_9BURK|nr:hypothetical protein [Cupriavidus basilensis]MDF3832436.1 hypothetical protein [Cupriavidus basilensis]
MKQRFYFLLFFALPATTYAQAPPAPVVESCLIFDAIHPSLRIDKIDGVATINDDPQRGYSTYTYDYRGLRVGYATRAGKSDLIIFGKHATPLSKAKGIEGASPEKINASKADFGIIHHNNNDYYCISSDFDGIGRSGTFQNIRMAYISRIPSSSRRSAALNYSFSVRDIRQIKQETDENISQK